MESRKNRLSPWCTHNSRMLSPATLGVPTHQMCNPTTSEFVTWKVLFQSVTASICLSSFSVPIQSSSDLIPPSFTKPEQIWVWSEYEILWHSSKLYFPYSLSLWAPSVPTGKKHRCPRRPVKCCRQHLLPWISWWGGLAVDGVDGVTFRCGSFLSVIIVKWLSDSTIVMVRDEGYEIQPVTAMVVKQYVIVI